MSFSYTTVSQVTQAILFEFYIFRQTVNENAFLSVCMPRPVRDRRDIVK